MNIEYFVNTNCDSFYSLDKEVVPCNRFTLVKTYVNWNSIFLVFVRLLEWKLILCIFFNNFYLFSKPVVSFLCPNQFDFMHSFPNKIAYIQLIGWCVNGRDKHKNHSYNSHWQIVRGFFFSFLFSVFLLSLEIKPIEQNHFCDSKSNKKKSVWNWSTNK